MPIAWDGSCPSRAGDNHIAQLPLDWALDGPGAVCVSYVRRFSRCRSLARPSPVGHYSVTVIRPCRFSSVTAVQEMTALNDMRSEQMHTCAPPKNELKKRFEETAEWIEGFGHMLLEQIASDDGSLAVVLKPYFESAHLDARTHFHEYIGIDLHPDAGRTKSTVAYPNSLPTNARRGLFGEVLAGLLTESYKYVGEYIWSVPAFLFRYHEDASHYLFTLARNPDRTREVIGRHGTDFFGISLSSTGEVVRMISGEAKWRMSPTPAEMENLLLGEWKRDRAGGRKRSGKGVLEKLNDKTIPLSGARQLQRILEQIDPKKFDAAIFRLEQALVPIDPKPIPNTNLIVVAGNRSPTRKKGTCLLPRSKIPAEYKVRDDLQIVEIVFKDGENLIDAIYNNLWVENEDACT